LAAKIGTFFETWQALGYIHRHAPVGNAARQEIRFEAQFANTEFEVIRAEHRA